MKKLLLATAIAASTVGFTSAASAGVSANAGFVSDYYYRGVNLGDAGMYGGVDYEEAGFYAGVWAIDDGTAGNDGLEYDLYAGYGLEVEGVSLSVGYTLYKYTYTSDEESEVNLGIGFGGFAFDYAMGSDDQVGGDYDYDFFSVSWSGDVFGAAVGSYDNDLDEEYKYVEFSASGEVGGVDVTASIGTVFDAEASGVPATDLDGYMVLDVSKSFDL